MAEQAVLAFGLSMGVRQQILDAGGGLTWRSAVGFVVAALSVMVGQKMRSIADRQAEANEAAGVTDAQIECYEAQARWSLLSQVFGLATSAAMSPNWWHFACAVYVAFYRVGWRAAYRSWGAL